MTTTLMITLNVMMSAVAVSLALCGVWIAHRLTPSTGESGPRGGRGPAPPAT